MTIRSDPPGALVQLEGKAIGYTPVSVDFTYYGTREITLVKDGYETLTVMQKVKTPWYQVFPLDLISDNLLLHKVRDRHEFRYQMQPRPAMESSQDLINRGRSLRSESMLGL